jgi:hypothetical protein
MYSDCSAGLTLFGMQIQKLAKSAGSRDKRVFFVQGDDDPNSPDAKYNHTARIGDLIDRNSDDGPNQRMLSRSCIIFVYSLWGAIRPLYASAVGRDQQDVSSDVFGDLRLYRNAIVHNNGILEKQPSILTFVKVGEPVQLTRSQMDELFRALFDEVNRISVQCTGDHLRRAFNRNLNPPPSPQNAA